MGIPDEEMGLDGIGGADGGAQEGGVVEIDLEHVVVADGGDAETDGRAEANFLRGGQIVIGFAFGLFGDGLELDGQVGGIAAEE